MQKIFQITFLIILFTFSAIANDQKVGISKVTEIYGVELKKMLDDHASLLIIDTRDPEIYANGHIPGAVNLTPDKVNFATLDELNPDKDSKIVFYCENETCQSSMIGAAKAIGAGYNYVYHYSGGFADWLSHGYPPVMD